MLSELLWAGPQMGLWSDSQVRLFQIFLHVDDHFKCGLEQQVERFWKMEGCEEDDSSLSVSDKQVVAYWRESITLVNGHYQLLIPVKKHMKNIPHNFVVAEERFRF
jgi:hypothetical protein